MASIGAGPSTSDGRRGVPAPRSGSNGGRSGTVTARTKRNMVKKALIVCERWGPSIKGGITDALHLVIRLLQDMGISVYCTALQATVEEVEDAERHGVTLVLPTQSGTLQFRKPHRDWLLYHNEHYPHLEDLANVKFVFGFSAFTSEAAFKILNKVFPKASCYLINLFDKDDITPLIVGCSKEELEFRKRILSDEFLKARCAFSVGENVYARYKRFYSETQHHLLCPIVNQYYVKSSTPDELGENEVFQILTVLQEYELQDPEKIDVVLNALKTASETIHLYRRAQIVWKIVGVPPGEEHPMLEDLRRTSGLKIMQTVVTNTLELDKELLSSHLVLIPPSSTNYTNLTLAAMCAGIPVVYPERSLSRETVNKHIDILEATECAIDMDGGHMDLTKRIRSVITKNRTALQKANRIREHIKENVVKDVQGTNVNFIAALSEDMLESSDNGDTETRHTESYYEQQALAGQDKTSENDNIQTVPQDEGEDEPIPKKKRAKAAEHRQAPEEMAAEWVPLHHTSGAIRGVPSDANEKKRTGRRKRRQGNRAQTPDSRTASRGEREVESVSTPKQARQAEHIPGDNSSREGWLADAASRPPRHARQAVLSKRRKKKGQRKRRSAPTEDERKSVQVATSSSDIREETSVVRKRNTTRRRKRSRKRDSISTESLLDAARSSRKAGQSPLSRWWKKKGKRERRPGEVEIRVKPNGIVPKKGKTVGEVDAAFYSNTHTKINADKFGKDLDNRHKNMRLQKIGKNSISYIMTCRSLDALESLMDSYRNENLQRTVTSTFVSDQLLRDVGAMYLSLGVSIDYEEYYLCQEELENAEDGDTLGVDSNEQRISADNNTTDVTALQQETLDEIELMNDKMEKEIKAKQMSNSVEQSRKREKVTNRDILRAMENKEKRDCDAKIDELMSEWIDIKEDLKGVSETQSGLVLTRRQLIQKAGAIIHEVDILLEIKQELLLVFQKFLPAGPEKTTEPDPKLVIEGSVLIDYVENTVHDADIPTERKQEIIRRFSDFIKDESKKMTVKDRLTAQQVKPQERANAVVHDANIPDQLKETYVNWRRVERGTPLSNTVRVLLSRDGKKSSGEVFYPYGLTINQNGHVLVCDYGRSDHPGSVKTVTADTAQILTSVTVHGLPRNFKPTDTKMADNGDYYTADIGNKCIVVSDAKSEVKQIIAMGKLKYPTGVFVDKDRNVFIADYLADCVIKCNGDGDIISSQQLSQPWSLTMNSKYQLIVSCRGDVKCIYVLDSNLEILNQFGSYHLVKPWGVTVDNADNIYVADVRKIVKFDRQGEYQETVTVDGYPNYIAVFTDGRIVYSDGIDHTVKVIYK